VIFILISKQPPPVGEPETPVYLTDRHERQRSAMAITTVGSTTTAVVKIKRTSIKQRTSLNVIVASSLTKGRLRSRTRSQILSFYLIIKIIVAENRNDTHRRRLKLFEINRFYMRRK